jgi:hypothetical protein
VLPALRRSPDLAPAVAPVEDAFAASARRSALIAAAFVFVGLLAALRLPAAGEAAPEAETTV